MSSSGHAHVHGRATRTGAWCGHVHAHGKDMHVRVATNRASILLANMRPGQLKTDEENLPWGSLGQELEKSEDDTGLALDRSKATLLAEIDCLMTNWTWARTMDKTLCFLRWVFSLRPPLWWSQNHEARSVQSVPCELPPGTFSKFPLFKTVYLGDCLSQGF